MTKIIQNALKVSDSVFIMLKLDTRQKMWHHSFKSGLSNQKELQAQRSCAPATCIDKCVEVLNFLQQILLLQLLATAHSVCSRFPSSFNNLILSCVSLQMGSIKEALQSCNEVLSMDPENIDALVDRAEAYITNEEYDKGGYLCVFSACACAGLFMYQGPCRRVRRQKSSKLSSRFPNHKRRILHVS